MKFSPILQSRAKPLSCQIKFNAQCTEFFLTALMVASQRGGLAPFMRASLIPVRDADGPFTSRSDMWPCPPQVWGRWTELSSLSPKRRRRHRFLRLRAQAVQKLVIALNWLTLGHVMKPPVHARVGFPMSQRQADMLEHLDELVAFLLKAGTVNQESLGRAGEKLNKLSLLAFNLPEASKSLSFGDLDSFLSILHSQFDSYSNPKKDIGNTPGLSQSLPMTVAVYLSSL